MTIGLTAARAAKAYLESLELDTIENFYAEVEDPDAAEGNSANNRALPCVICYCSNAVEYPPRCGNWNLNLHFRLVVSADDSTAEQLAEMFDEVFEAINTDSICDDLTAAATAATPTIPFHVFGFWGDVQQSDQRIENRNRVIEIVLPINCCPKAIS